jgi:Lysyl-tRNA synthetase (class II)
MTGQQAIQEVLFFPQMKPEKAQKKDSVDKFTALGIPVEWVEIVLKQGILLVENLKELNPNKFHQDICGINKKNKLGLTNPSKEEVANWIEKA